MPKVPALLGTWSVTLITTVQQLMTSLQSAETEDDRFVIVTRTVCGPVMKKIRHSFGARAVNLALLCTCNSSNPPEGW
jgi:hypothetical protein